MATVLVVDDHDNVVVTIAAVLSTVAPMVAVAHARDGLAAIDYLVAHPAQIVLIVLDVAMPGLDGINTAIRLREIVPAIPILPYTGSSDPATNTLLVEHGCLPPLSKGAPLAVVAHHVRCGLGATTTPVAVPAGSLHYMRSQASAHEQTGRTQRQRQRIVYAPTRVDRHYLQALAAAINTAVTHTYATLPAELAVQAVVLTTVPAYHGAHAWFAHAAHPLVIVATDLATALRARAQSATRIAPTALVLEHPHDSTMISRRLLAALDAVEGGRSVMPQAVADPFGTLGLPDDLLVVLLGDIQQQTNQQIASACTTDVAPRTVQRRRQALRAHLGGAAHDDHVAWALAWWATAHQDDNAW